MNHKETKTSEEFGITQLGGRNGNFATKHIIEETANKLPATQVVTKDERPSNCLL